MKIVGFEHLHRHTDFSLLDGYGTVEEYAERSNKINQKYLCITDHGMMAAIPRQIKACDEHKLNPIFGCELYVQDKHPSPDIFSSMSKEEKRAIRKSYHLLAIAHNLEGYRNLVKLCSWGWINGFYYKPRVTHEQILKNKEGIIFTSCCYNSEIGQAFDQGGEEAGFAMIEKYMSMFGDKFYLELMLLDFKKQKPYDAFIIKAYDKYHIPLIITQDCHYSEPEDSKFQRYMLMIQKKTTIKDIENRLSAEDKEDIFELQDTNLWMKSEEELNDKWQKEYQEIIPYDLFIQSKLNTVKICELAKGVQLDRNPKLPQLPDADERFKEALIEGFIYRDLKGKREYELRLKEEYELICRKGLSSYFLIQKQIIDEARKISPKLLGWGTGDEVVGPGRGCLSPDTKIVLYNGIAKRIDEIKIGDKVITHDGSAQKVLDVLRYDVDEPLLKINDAILTKDHLISCEKFNKIDWIRADNINVGDWAFTPIRLNECCRPINNGFLTSIRDVEEVKGISSVYDLTVENNHNYLTTSFLVHNSAVGSLACYCLRITDVDPVHHGLLFSRFLSENRGGRSMKLRFSMNPLT